MFKSSRAEFLLKTSSAWLKYIWVAFKYSAPAVNNSKVEFAWLMSIITAVNLIVIKLSEFVLVTVPKLISIISNC